MEMAQTMEGGAGVGVMSTPMIDIGLSLRKPSDMSRAFILAMGLHVAGLMLLVTVIHYWPVAVRVQQAPPLELDVAATPVVSAATVVPEPPVLSRAIAEVPAEARSMAMPMAPIPEARALSVSEPAVTVSSVGETWLPVTPEITRETAGVGVAFPLSIVSSPVRTTGDPGGRPIALSEIKPHYPYAARTRGEAGRVTVHVRVTGEGAVDSAVVSSSSGVESLDQSALAATRKARFKPAEKGGKAVQSDMDLQFDFRLQD